MKSIPEDEIGERKYEDTRDAFFVFFKVIVYWMQHGYDSQAKTLM